MQEKHTPPPYRSQVNNHVLEVLILNNFIYL
jgi:hypothetical protein